MSVLVSAFTMFILRAFTGLLPRGCRDTKALRLKRQRLICLSAVLTKKPWRVLIWWSHIRHKDIPEEIAERVKQRVLDGMGFIVLHSSHLCKPFVKLMGTCCRSKWRENNEKERIWVVEPAHPIARDLPEFIELEEEETYGERFDIPTPDELVFISWFSGGEVFRSGCCWKRGLGKIFYFRPGHEAYPTYYRDDIRQIIANAVDWAKPSRGPKPTLGNVKKPYENLKAADHSDEYHP